MENKVNFMQVINFRNLFHTRRGERNSKNMTESRQRGCDSFRYILMAEFHLH